MQSDLRVEGSSPSSGNNSTTSSDSPPSEKRVREGSVCKPQSLRAPTSFLQSKMKRSLNLEGRPLPEKTHFLDNSITLMTEDMGGECAFVVEEPSVYCSHGPIKKTDLEQVILRKEKIPFHLDQQYKGTELM
ncbi:hypothetical protein Vadar_012512 [Vaccinium darrowii]|uniref:Uncharacterized protein n=1 Tax=Vaccinium darrowii TaxID=229202 RepID=A0ACB7XH05_9ERIC|nr:hypothetical protein Vadar_012512 [Vaccinium darrowii]